MTEETAIQPSSVTHVERLYRLLGLFARLAREADVDGLLRQAVDAAIELSGAERGFVLVLEGDALSVHLSADRDGAPVRGAREQISRSVVAEAVATGEAVVTVDARRDARFEAAASVHRRSLTSVLCLPIEAAGDLIGALYLDHRFRSGVFDSPVPRLMSGFADLLAVALTHLSRRDELAAQNARLAEANAEVERLLHETRRLKEALEQRCADLESNLEAERKRRPLRFEYDEIVGDTPAMLRVLEQVDRLVDTTLPVVITGESGTGKELVARAIHAKGPRHEKPFVAINCGALSESLLESELFGHTKGAFTGADRARSGLFVSADGGTLFLDEVNALTRAAQVKLLRVLQEGCVRPVGGGGERNVDVRVVAASNQSLLGLVGEGGFREDLYYRLAGLVLRMPALRERREDIPALIRHLLSRSEGSAPSVALDPEALGVLYRHDWPGNVRQLQNALRASAALCRGGTIRAADVRVVLDAHSDRRASPRPGARRPGPRLKAAPDEVRAALQRASGDRQRAAAELGVSLRTLYRYLDRWGL